MRKGMSFGIVFICLIGLVLAFMATAVTANTETTFNNPIAPGDFPDPTIYKHTDGYYYYSHTDSGSINLYRSSTISGIKEGVSKVILTEGSGTAYSYRLWASEIQYINGVWYIYFCADSGLIVNHRLFVISNSNADPLQGTWSTPIKLFDPANDHYAIDPSILNQNGSLFLLYSGAPTSGTTGPQNIYILKLSDPTTVTGNRTLISSPDTEDAGVNEAPSVIQRNGKFFVTISGNTFDSNDYHLDMLTASDTANLMLAGSWVKTSNVFTKNTAAGVYGVGSNAFIKSQDGTEDWLVYHGCVMNRCATWRPTFAQKITWNADGTPNFGVPVSKSALLNVPSGEVGSSPLLVNAGFEYDGTAAASPKGWSKTGTNPEAFFTSNTGGNKSGSYHATHTKTAAYQVYSSQTVMDMPNGSYTLSAWVKSSGGQSNVYMEAKDFGGTAILKVIPAAADWLHIQIADVNVTNGQFTIGFYSNASANQWLYYDNVSLTPTKTTYKASTDFSAFQGKNQWYYQEWNGTNYLTTVWDWQANKWVGSYPYNLIWAPSQMHPDSNNAVRTWAAPKSGSVLINGNARKATSGGDGVNVKIMQNNTQIWPASGWQFISGSDTTGMDHSFHVNVTGGDKIYFVVNKSGNIDYDETVWDPAISYSWWKASVNFSTVQGQNNWYYKNGAGYTNMTWDSGRNSWVGAYFYNLIWSPSQMHPDVNDTVRAWQAPRAGQVNISGVFKKANTGGDGVNAKVMRNGTQIWPASGWQYISGSNTTGMSHNINVTLGSGDWIYFIINRNGDNYFDETTWDPSIYFTS
ncbi:MAG TPA: glycoside hydrolase family 43 protein [Bacilli bacterium]